VVHVTEVGVAFSYWLLSVTVGEEFDLYSEMRRNPVGRASVISE